MTRRTRRHVRSIAPASRWKWAAGIVTFLVVIGMAGIASARSRSRKRRISVWWDVIGSLTVRKLDQYIADLKTLGVSGVVIMLNEAYSDTLNTAFTERELEVFTAALRKNGIWFGLDTWIKPSRAYIESLPALFPLAKRLGASFIEFDVEGPWKPAQVVGYASLEEASKHVASVMSRSPVPWGVTTLMERLKTTAWTIAKYGSFVALQGYSRVHTDDPRGTLPGVYQQRVYNDSRAVCGPDMPFIMGLAAFDQEGFSDMTPKTAMLAAAKASYDLGVRELRFWSWKWIAGPQKNGYAYNALLEMRNWS